MTARLKTAIDRIECAEAALLPVVQNEFPVGAKVMWVPSDRTTRQKGTVLDYGSGGHRIQVQNDYTARVYWIAVGRILDAM